ncbi:MAG: hypothetical protein ACFCVG_17570, partial [Kineosporiaceae bacterium]
GRAPVGRALVGRGARAPGTAATASAGEGMAGGAGGDGAVRGTEVTVGRDGWCSRTGSGDWPSTASPWSAYV